MIDYDEILKLEPFSLNSKEKNDFLVGILSDLTVHHLTNCFEYSSIIKSMGFNLENVRNIDEFPFLPVRMFKKFSLKSISDKEIVKTMTSSGTTGQQVSRIYIDRETARNQTKTLTKIVSSYLGTKRCPMIIIDSPAVLKDRNMFSARGAGILGFSIFASERFYAFNDSMELDVDGLLSFLDRHKGQKIFLFGFTYMIWLHFYKEIIKNNFKIDLSDGILIHGGGWKKTLSQSVSKEEFKNRLENATGIKSIHDYYGMVEQTGTIYVECEEGHLHSSIFSDVIVRKAKDFSVADIGESGIIQLLSVLPYSYPGHSIITEDEGVILGEDDCPCGRLGKYFKINGRIKNAEIRGCSDTYEQNR